MGNKRTEVSGFIDPVLTIFGGGGGGQANLHTISSLDPGILIPTCLSVGEKALIGRLGLAKN